MLYISVRTAETHRAHIMQKLRLDDPRRARPLRPRQRRCSTMRGGLREWPSSALDESVPRPPEPLRHTAAPGLGFSWRRMGHRALDVADVQQADLALVDRGEGVGDERVEPGLGRS